MNKENLKFKFEVIENKLKCIFIIGRTNDLNEQEKLDYRIIKNKYCNIINIIKKLENKKLTNYIF